MSLINKSAIRKVVKELDKEKAISSIADEVEKPFLVVKIR